MNAPRIVCNRKTKPRKGAVLVLVTLLLSLLFAMCAFSLDTGNIINAKTTLMAAADSAALATAGEMTASDGYDFENLRATAINYAHINVPEGYGHVIDTNEVCFGVWNPDTHSFTATEDEPNAVKVVVQRSEAHNNPLPFTFGRLFGYETANISAEAIAVGAPTTDQSNSFNSVYVTSSKDLSNVVLLFYDGSTQKFEGLHGYTATFQGTGEQEGKEVHGCWIKSGCNASGDGPGYGEFIEFPGDDTTVHGENRPKGCVPHVSATFNATGPTFLDAGALGPVRLVK
jgi:Flp pilus assembly protein TadG